MALNVPVFITRLGSAVVFAIIMLAGVLWNEWSFLALICLINALCLGDYFRLMKKIDIAAYWPPWLFAAMQAIALLAIAPLIFWKHIDDGILPRWPVALWYIMLAAPALALLGGALHKKNGLMATLQAMGGLLYITAPMFMLVMMRLHFESCMWPLALILMIWCNDTMAYLVGSFIGKTPFSPISPKKTWEGTAGGALLTIAGAAICGRVIPGSRIIDWIMVALCAAVAGTLGDLLESKLKRIANVKDSGSLMPGHGGALDRFDSLLIATPFAFIYLMYFMY